MVEVLHYTKIYREDLALGNQTAEVRLADNSLQTVTEIDLAGLLQRRTVTVVPGTGGLVSIPNLILAGMRIFGITVHILETLGNSNGMTAFDVGAAPVIDRWGIVTSLLQGTKTSQGDFRSSDLPIFATAQDVLLAAHNGTFDGTGRIEVRSHSMPLTHD